MVSLYFHKRSGERRGRKVDPWRDGNERIGGKAGVDEEQEHEKLFPQSKASDTASMRIQHTDDRIKGGHFRLVHRQSQSRSMQ